MSFLDKLAVLNAQPIGQPQPKDLPHQVAKAEKKQTKADEGDAFRKAVWARDKRRSRASKRPLTPSGTDYDKVGEVHHRLPRSTNPDRVYDVPNGILISKGEHLLAETRCPGDMSHFMLEITGPDDLGEKQLFLWRNVDGTEKRRRQE